MCILLFVTDDSMLDNAFFQYIGGIEGNYFIRVLDLDIDDDNELNYPLIMSHSFQLSTLCLVLFVSKNIGYLCELIHL